MNDANGTGTHLQTGYNVPPWIQMVCRLCELKMIILQNDQKGAEEEKGLTLWLTNVVLIPL